MDEDLMQMLNEARGQGANETQLQGIIDLYKKKSGGEPSPADGLNGSGLFGNGGGTSQDSLTDPFTPAPQKVAAPFLSQEDKDAAVARGIEAEQQKQDAFDADPSLVKGIVDRMRLATENKKAQDFADYLKTQDTPGSQAALAAVTNANAKYNQLTADERQAQRVSVYGSDEAYNKAAAAETASNLKLKQEVQDNVNREDDSWWNIVPTTAGAVSETVTKTLSGITNLFRNYTPSGPTGAQPLYNPDGTESDYARNMKWADDPLGKLIMGLDGQTDKAEYVMNADRLPDTIAGRVTTDIAKFAPDMAVLGFAPEAELPEAAAEAPKAISVLGKYIWNPFTKWMVAKGAISGYGEAERSGAPEGEALTAGLEGAGTGFISGGSAGILGGVGGAMSDGMMSMLIDKGVVTKAGALTKAGLDVLSDATVFGGAPVVQAGITAAITGKPADTDELGREVESGVGMGVFFGGIRGIKGVQANNAANEQIKAYMNARQTAAMDNFAIATPDAIAEAYNNPLSSGDLNAKAIDAAMKAANQTDPDKKQQLFILAKMYAHASDVKAVTNAVINDKDGFVHAIAQADILPQDKAMLINKFNLVDNLMNPHTIEENTTKDKVNTLSQKITDLQNTPGAVDPVKNPEGSANLISLVQEKTTLQVQLLEKAAGQQAHVPEPGEGESQEPRIKNQEVAGSSGSGSKEDAGTATATNLAATDITPEQQAAIDELNRQRGVAHEGIVTNENNEPKHYVPDTDFKGNSVEQVRKMIDDHYDRSVEEVAGGSSSSSKEELPTATATATDLAATQIEPGGSAEPTAGHVGDIKPQAVDIPGYGKVDIIGVKDNGDVTIKNADGAVEDIPKEEHAASGIMNADVKAFKKENGIKDVLPETLNDRIQGLAERLHREPNAEFSHADTLLFTHYEDEVRGALESVGSGQLAVGSEGENREEGGQRLEAGDQRLGGKEGGNSAALDDVAATAAALKERIEPDYKNTITDKLNSFNKMVKDGMPPTVLEFVEKVLPRSIALKYKNLYEIATRNGLKLDIGRYKVAPGALGSWSGAINLDPVVSKTHIDNWAEFTEVLNHEIIHGLLERGLNHPNQYKLHDALSGIMERVKKEAENAPELVREIIGFITDSSQKSEIRDYSHPTGVNYENGAPTYKSTGDLEELVTYAFTDQDFAKWLDTLPSEKAEPKAKGKQTIFTELKNIVREFIGKLAGRSALDDINEVVNKYFDVRWNEKQYADRNKLYWNEKMELRADAFDKYQNDPQQIAEAYHQAKADGGDPELVNAVEDQERGIKNQEGGQRSEVSDQRLGGEENIRAAQGAAGDGGKMSAEDQAAVKAAMEHIFPDTEAHYYPTEEEFNKALENITGITHNYDGVITHGFVDRNDVIHFNPRYMERDTQLHEQAHILTKWAKANAPELYRRIMSAGRVMGNMHQELLKNGYRLKGNPLFEESFVTAIGREASGKIDELIKGRIERGAVKQLIHDLWTKFERFVVGKTGLALSEGKNIKDMTVGEFMDYVNRKYLMSDVRVGEKRSEVRDQRLGEESGSGSSSKEDTVTATAADLAATDSIRASKSLPEREPGESLRDYMKRVGEKSEVGSRKSEVKNQEGGGNEPPAAGTPSRATDEFEAPKWEAPAETKEEQAKRKMGDSYNRIGVLQRAIEAAGGRIGDESDYHNAVDLQAAKIAQRQQELKEQWIKSPDKAKPAFFERMHTDGIEKGDFDSYIQAKHVGEFNRVVGERRRAAYEQELERLERNRQEAVRDNRPFKERYYERAIKDMQDQKNERYPLMDDGASGMTNAEAKEILDKLDEEGKTAGLEKYADEYNKGVSKRQLEDQLESGIISKDAYDKLNKQFENYVPFHVESYLEPLHDEAPIKRNSGKKLVSVDPVIRRAKGAPERKMEERVNPSAYGLVQLEKAYTEGQVNKTANVLYNLVEQNPNDGVFEIVNPKYVPVKRGDGTWSHFAEITPKEIVNNSVQLYRDGRKVYIHIKDPLMRRAVSRNGIVKSVKALGAVQNAFSTVRVKFSPEFWVTNAMKHIGFAAFNLSSDGKSDIAWAMLKQSAPAMKAAFDWEHGSRDGEWAPWVERYLRSGAKLAGIAPATDMEKLRGVQDAIAEIGQKKNLVRNTRAILDYVATLGDASGVGPRLAVFRAAAERGMSDQQAAALSREASINFNKKGEWSPFAGNLYFMINAHVQGSISVYDAVKNRPLARKMAAATVVMGVMAAAINHALSKPDDEPVSEYDKMNNFVFKNPATGGNFMIPIPFGATAPYYLGTKLYEVMSGQAGPGAAALNVLSNTLNATAPFGHANLGQTLMPTEPGRAMLQYYSNTNSFGGPIFKDPKDARVMQPGSTVHFESTAPEFTALAESLNHLSGGTQTKSGYADFSPDVMQWIYNTATGAPGQLAQTSFEEQARAYRGLGGTLPPGLQLSPAEIKQVPLLRKFYTEGTPVNYKSQIFQLLEKSGDHEMDGTDTNNFFNALTGAAVKGQITMKQLETYRREYMENMRRIQIGDAMPDADIKEIDRGRRR